MKAESGFTKKRSWIPLGNLQLAQAGLLLCCLAASTGSAQTYTVLHRFTGPDGRRPQAGLVLSGTTLYGTASFGGAAGYGTVFKINTDGTGYTVLRHITGSDGLAPAAGLILSGTTLYGTTHGQGDFWYGSIFKLNTDGSGFTVLKTLNGSSDGDGPYDLVLSDAALYGAASAGGRFGRGTVFRLDTDGGSWAVLQDFALTNGANPWTGLVLSGGPLYGATVNGGEMCCGTVFQINTDGSGFALLKSFGGGDYPGTNPGGELVIADTTLYGTTINGPRDRSGTVFQINTDGSGCTNLHIFSGASDGFSPRGLRLDGHTLYGTTLYGGITNPSVPLGYGTVFKVNTDGSGFTTLKQFTGSDDGGSPSEGRLVVSGKTLYGATWSGGTSNQGVLFALTLPGPPVVLAPPSTQTAELGSAIVFRTRASGSAPVGYEWRFNGSPLSGLTNDSLQLADVQYSQAGAYTVVVTDPFGSVTSAPAMLNVIAPVERRPVPGINLAGEAGSSLNVDYADSLAPQPAWVPLDTVSLTNTSQLYFDLAAPLPPQRFYRAWQTGTPSVLPSLDVHMVLAITLIGSIGDSLRLDYINQIGPTNGWVTLDTVTLTNTSQLYFDTSSIGQPRRLYRIVPGP